MVNTQVNHELQATGIFCWFGFYDNIDSVVFHQHFWEIYEHDKDKDKLRHHHVIPMVCTLIEQSSRPISTQEVVQLL